MKIKNCLFGLIAITLFLSNLNLSYASSPLRCNFGRDIICLSDLDNIITLRNTNTVNLDLKNVGDDLKIYGFFLTTDVKKVSCNEIYINGIRIDEKTAKEPLEWKNNQTIVVNSDCISAEDVMKVGERIKFNIEISSNLTKPIYGETFSRVMPVTKIGILFLNFKDHPINKFFSHSIFTIFSLLLIFLMLWILTIKMMKKKAMPLRRINHKDVKVSKNKLR